MDSWARTPGFGFLGLESWAWIPGLGFLGLESWVCVPGLSFLDLDAWPEPIARSDYTYDLEPSVAILRHFEVTITDLTCLAAFYPQKMHGFARGSRFLTHWVGDGIEIEQTAAEWRPQHAL